MDNKDKWTASIIGALFVVASIVVWIGGCQVLIDLYALYPKVIIGLIGFILVAIILRIILFN